jgi:cysteinyl-tRNA synthetase
MPFRFHDTLTGETRDFEPREPGVVRMYNCGPTVYSSPQIGNYRAWTFVDVLRRSLELGGFEVRQIMNLTDVGHLTLDDIESGEDKMEAASRLEGKTAWEIAEHYIAEFHDAVKRLNFAPAERYPRATDHIPEMIEIIEGLIARGHAYVTESGNVYFDVSSFPAYGRLSGNRLEDLEAGARVEVLDEKRHHADFALWKRDDQHQMQWDSPWGRGFPGWHVECSAMGRKYLGDELDIHTGGEDNIFPHHECEIAQSEGFSGKTFVRYWLHNRHLLVDGRKMSKSAGTQYSFDDVIERGHSPRALRYLLLQTHYRLPMNFTWEGLAGAARAVASLDTAVRGIAIDDGVADDPSVAETCARIDGAFLAALQDDLNVSAALASVHELKSFTNKRGALSSADAVRVRALWQRLDSVLGLELLTHADAEPVAQDDDAEIQALVDGRTAARAAREWARADEIRDELTARGIKLEDGPDGVRWSRG